MNPKVMCVYITDINDDKKIFRVITHCVVQIGNKIYDPSYEFIDITTDKNVFKQINLPNDEYKKEILQNYVKLAQVCEKINNGELYISKEYYHKQADFCELVARKLFNIKHL
jgi:S-adenosylmethionine synthetase